MAKSTPANTEQDIEIVAEQNSEIVSDSPVGLSYGPDKGGNILAAWQGLYHLFGARCNFTVTHDGVFVDNLTVSPQYDAATIVEDISKHNRRLELFPTMFWAQGEAPEDFEDIAAITALMVQYWRGSVEDNTSKTPNYLKDAVADYKAANNLLRKRGPKRKVFRLDNLEDIDEDVLRSINPEALARLRDAINAAEAANAAMAATE